MISVNNSKKRKRTQVIKGENPKNTSIDFLFDSSLDWNKIGAEDLEWINGKASGFAGVEELDGDAYAQFESQLPSRPKKKIKADNNIQKEKKKKKENNTSLLLVNNKSKNKQTKAKSKSKTKKEEEENIEEEIAEQIVEEILDFSKWDHFNLSEEVMEALKYQKFTNPSPIQELAIPAALRDLKDVLGSAQTGSGKTLAFGIPIIERLLRIQKLQQKKNKSEDTLERKLQGLILAPTRELAIQVSDHLKKIAKFTNIKISAIVGGISLLKQERLVNQEPDIVVATPGRLWELIQTEPYLMDLNDLKFLVLDEADRMIEEGHFRELDNIFEILPENQEGDTQIQIEDNKQQNKKSILKIDNTKKNSEVSKNDSDSESLSDSEEIQEEIKNTKQSSNNNFINKRQTFIFSATLMMKTEFLKKKNQIFQKKKIKKITKIFQIKIHLKN